MAIFNMTSASEYTPITGDGTTTKIKIRKANYIEIGPAEILDGSPTGMYMNTRPQLSANRESGVIYGGVSTNAGNIYSWNEDGTITEITTISLTYLPATSFNNDDGFLYAGGYNNDTPTEKNFYKIDPSDGTRTLLATRSWATNGALQAIAAKDGTLHFLGRNGSSGSSTSATVAYGEIDIETGTITNKISAASGTQGSIHYYGCLGVTGSGTALGYFHKYIWKLTDRITLIRADNYTEKTVYEAKGFFGADEKLALVSNPFWNHSSDNYYYPSGTYLVYDDENQTFIDKGDITLPQNWNQPSFLFGMNNGKIREVVSMDGGTRRIDMDKLYTITAK